MDKKRKVIGVFGARIFEWNAMDFISQLKKVALEKGYFTVVFSSGVDTGDDADEVKAANKIFELSRSGDFKAFVILTETIKNKKLIREIVDIGKEKNIPVFSLDGEVDGCYNLTMDYSNGFRQLVHHIIKDHGARYINMLAGFKGNEFSDTRIRIYKEVLAEYGIPFEEERLAYGDFWARPSEIAVRKFLATNDPKPDAILCANDSMAITTCSVLKEEGFKVPNDIMVTGFDGIQSAKYHTPMLTTCEPSYKKSLNFIFSEIKKVEKSREVSPTGCIVEFKMTPSQSCGCRPKKYYDRNRIISTLFDDVGDCAWHNHAMNQMVTSVLTKQKVMDVAEILPETVKLWSDHFHFACIKSECLDSYEVPSEFSEMITILRGDKGEFEKPGEKFPADSLIPRFEEMLEEESGIDVLVVRALNTSDTVYGYIAEGFQDLNDRRLQRCNEFGMFLSNSIYTVLYNKKLNVLNESLQNAYNEISLLSIQDSMTGIYNRRGFYQRLTDFLRCSNGVGSYLFMISIDMDRLKYINDTFGHAEGDFAITTVSHAIMKVVGEDAICARFGGDEFTCAVFADTENAYTEEGLAKAINKQIQMEPGVTEKPYPVGVSVGVACRPVEDGMDTESLIMAADQKMYADKVKRKQQRPTEK